MEKQDKLGERELIHTHKMLKVFLEVLIQVTPTFLLGNPPTSFFSYPQEVQTLSMIFSWPIFL